MTKILFVAVQKITKSILERIATGTFRLMEISAHSDIIPQGVMSIAAYTGTKADIDYRVVHQSLNTVRELYKHGINEDYIRQTAKQIAENFDEYVTRDILAQSDGWTPDIIAFSLLFDTAIPAFEAEIPVVRKRFPNALIVAGGHPINALYEYVLQRNGEYLNGVCFGEGEIPFAELVLAADRINYLEESFYWFTPENNRLKNKKPSQAFITNLDDIPIYDYDLILNAYGEDAFNYRGTKLLDKKRYGEIITTRGCPFNCSFCSSQRVHGHRVRYNSLERVKETIDIFIDKYKCDAMTISDDHFLADVPRAIEIIDYISAKGASVDIPNGVSIACVTKEFIECLERNGVYKVCLALESGSQRVLREIMHKPVSLSVAEKVLDMLAGSSVQAECFYIIGLAQETVQDIKDGLNWLHKQSYDWIQVYTLSPISGSEEFEKGLYKSKLLPDGSYNFENTSMYDSFLFKDRPDILREFGNDPAYTINLDLNFIHNSQMRRGEWVLAEKRFADITTKHKEHALGWYCLARCLKAQGKEYMEPLEMYRHIVANSEFWQKYVLYFELSESEL